MLSTNSDIQKEPVLIVQDDDKFYSRLLSKESSVSNTSFRVYYGVASGSVPFLWESQPGTPKHVSTGTAVPPLTPPPSYFYTARSKSSKLKSSKSLNLIHTILPRFSLRKNAHATSPSSPSSGSPSSASSVSSSSSFSWAASARRRWRRSSSTGLSFSSSRAEDEESDAGSPISTPLCFGGNLGRSYSVGLMKNFLLSVAGSHGSRHGAAAS